MRRGEVATMGWERGEVATMGWELLAHPPYSQDFATSDFRLFGPLKESLGGLKFKDDQDVQQHFD